MKLTNWIRVNYIIEKKKRYLSFFSNFRVPSFHIRGYEGTRRLVRRTGKMDKGGRRGERAVSFADWVRN